MASGSKSSDFASIMNLTHCSESYMASDPEQTIPRLRWVLARRKSTQSHPRHLGSGGYKSSASKRTYKERKCSSPSSRRLLASKRGKKTAQHVSAQSHPHHLGSGCYKSGVCKRTDKECICSSPASRGFTFDESPRSYLYLRPKSREAEVGIYVPEDDICRKVAERVVTFFIYIPNTFMIDTNRSSVITIFILMQAIPNFIIAGAVGARDGRDDLLGAFWEVERSSDGIRSGRGILWEVQDN